MDKIMRYFNDELNSLFANKEPRKLYDAMAYSALLGGKRLRPMLLLAACNCFGGEIKHAMPFALAIELIHTYSLIHDDLPAMDDDDLRRGRQTNHIVYGEAMAILAGDGLLNMAYELMSNSCADNFDKKNALAMKEISISAGAKGMVGGQAVDILSEGSEVSESTLRYIHEHKTASLICASLTAGATIGGACDTDIEKFRNAGKFIGFAFQVQDDILDYEGDEKTLGKPIRSDERNKKATYISMHGIEKSTADFKHDLNEAITVLESVKNTENLIQIVKNILHRDK